ncbi:alpha/beta fold hydrolase [uncultured Serinicoccus sp.]|uniref:alpha/beta hydrolase n=1 Tax=uncultured Serinicoccus sp. TaxID=735514 RepID=UPI0026089E63|nr:alpha/beta fold hydrolase [uncultured Serinicoccus sp.]
MHQTSRRRRLLRRLVRVGVVLLAVVAVMLVAVWGLQRYFIYFPDRSPVPPAAEVVPGARDVTALTSDGLELGAWLVPAEASADRDLAVLFAHGNGGNREGGADLARRLSERGFTVLLMDYRGYGGNPGTPSEEGLARDALAMSDLLAREGFPPERVVYVGESLGTGVVARLAEERPPHAMLLRSPFTDLVEVGRAQYPILPVGALLRDRFDVLSRVAQTTVPVTVVRAEEDFIVPSELSARVAAAAPTLVEEVVLPGVGHNDPAMTGPPLVDAVVRLVEAV